MTAQDILAKLFRPIDAERVTKAKGLAARAKIDWDEVLKAMTVAQRKAVDNAK